MKGRSNEYYSSPDEVFKIGKIDEIDFKCDTIDDLEKYIILILKDAKSVIDSYLKIEFKTIPEALHGVARDYCLNVLSNTRNISQLNGDMQNYMTYSQNTVFTKDLRERLDIIKGSKWENNTTVKVRFFNGSIRDERDNEKI